MARCFDLVLYYIRNAANRNTGPSPHEMLMGRPMSTGASMTMTLHRATLLWPEESMIDYVLALTNIPRRFDFQCLV